MTHVAQVARSALLIASSLAKFIPLTAFDPTIRPAPNRQTESKQLYAHKFVESRPRRRNGQFSLDNRDIFPFRLKRAICLERFLSQSTFRMPHDPSLGAIPPTFNEMSRSFDAAHAARPEPAPS
jgi:hypothetical protein